MGKIDVKKYVIRVLSPIYVGYSDLYEPFNFVVDSEASCIYFLDIDKFMLNLSDKDREIISRISNDVSPYGLIKFYNFMNSKLNYVKSNSSIIIRKINVCSGFISHYREVINMNSRDIREINNAINRFKIAMLSYNSNLNQPIIPGSSIKGAIRTAILNFYSNRVTGNIKKDWVLESKILNYRYPNEDPLKYLKVSDFLPKKVNTKIVYAVNVKKNGSRSSSIPQITEIIETGSEFEGTISIVNVNSKLSIDLSFKVIESALKQFYEKILKEEERIFSNLGTKSPIYLGNMPLKLGRHSGGEAVTVEGFRKIRIRQGRNRSYISDKTTTLWFASETKKDYLMDSLEPFAWAELIEDDRITNKLAQSKDKSKIKPKEKKTHSTKLLDLSSLQNKFKVTKKK